MVRSGVERSSLRAFMQTHVKRIQLDDGGRPTESLRPRWTDSGLRFHSPGDAEPWNPAARKEAPDWPMSGCAPKQFRVGSVSKGYRCPSWT